MKPNIIFIQCDSMDGRLMGCMKHAVMQRATKNLDSMAKNGTIFSNSYTNNPICCPSRASMWSGQYTFHCHGWNNYKGIPAESITFKTELEQAGYQTGIFGKTDYVSGNHTIRARVSAWTRTADIQRPTLNMAAPKIFETQEKRVHRGDWKTVDASIAWLKENSEKPFFLHLGLNAPHPEFQTSRYYLDMVNLEDITIPLKDEEKHPVMEFQKISKGWRHGVDEDMVRMVRSIYAAMIAETDAMVGEVLEAVRALCLEETTYVIFTSDHGEMNMEHDQFYKMNLYEASARIPMLVVGPNVKRGQRVDTLVSLIDVYPTLLEMANTSSCKELDGQSLMPMLLGKEDGRENVVFSEYHDCNINSSIFMVRKDAYKYLVYPDYPSVLFDLQNDPDERHNLCEELPEQVAELDACLRNIVNYNQVAEEVREYDKESFRIWREEQLAAGTYFYNMSKTFSGWDDLADEELTPWSEEEEAHIVEWLEEPNGYSK